MGGYNILLWFFLFLEDGYMEYMGNYDVLYDSLC